VRYASSVAEGAQMSRNTLYLVIAVLLVVVVGFGIYYAYQQSQKPSLEIKLGNQGVTVNSNP
jgi:hypothetical protein